VVPVRFLLFLSVPGDNPLDDPKGARPFPLSIVEPDDRFSLSEEIDADDGDVEGCAPLFRRR
jgi:hypothetical protein